MTVEHEVGKFSKDHGKNNGKCCILSKIQQCIDVGSACSFVFGTVDSGDGGGDG